MPLIRIKLLNLRSSSSNPFFFFHRCHNLLFSDFALGIALLWRYPERLNSIRRYCLWEFFWFPRRRGQSIHPKKITIHITNHQTHTPTKEDAPNTSSGNHLVLIYLPFCFLPCFFTSSTLISLASSYEQAINLIWNPDESRFPVQIFLSCSIHLIYV